MNLSNYTNLSPYNFKLYNQVGKTYYLNDKITKNDTIIDVSYVNRYSNNDNSITKIYRPSPRPSLEYVQDRPRPLPR